MVDLILSLFILIFILMGCEMTERKIISKTPLNDIRSKIENIPQKDRVNLENFFKLLIKDHNFAYTLFGSKPCSIAGYMNPMEYHTMEGLIPLDSFEFVIFEKGMESWSKYSHLFPSDKFILKKITFEGKPTFMAMLLINRETTIAILESQLDSIRNRYKLEGTTKDLFNKMILDEKFLQFFLQPAIEGILLGYGKGNAFHFEKARDLSININKNYSPPFNLETLKPLSRLFVDGYVSKGLEPVVLSSTTIEFSSLVDELNNLTNDWITFELTGGDYFLEEFQSPVFSTYSDNPETRKLNDNYYADRQKIIDAYIEKSFLEVTLNQWTQTNNNKWF